MSSATASALPRSRTWLGLAFVAGLFATPLIGLAFALSGLMPVDAAGRPPKWEFAIGQRALNVSLARRASGLVVPSNFGDAELNAGMKTYRNACAGCHGDFGQHRSGSGLYPPVPQFNQHPPDLTAAEMFVAVKYGVRYTGMGAWNDEIVDKDIWQTVAFLGQLSGLPPVVNDAWQATPQ